MKKPIRNFVLNVAAIALLAWVIPGVSFQSNLKILLLAALFLSLSNLLIKPILKIILLPINIITFGLAGWLIQVILLYITTLFVDGFGITSYVLGPANLLGVLIPKISFSGFWAFLGSAFALSIINSILYWIL